MPRSPSSSAWTALPIIWSSGSEVPGWRYDAGRGTYALGYLAGQDEEGWTHDLLVWLKPQPVEQPACGMSAKIAPFRLHPGVAAPVKQALGLRSFGYPRPSQHLPGPLYDRMPRLGKAIPAGLSRQRALRPLWPTIIERLLPAQASCTLRTTQRAVLIATNPTGQALALVASHRAWQLDVLEQDVPGLWRACWPDDARAIALPATTGRRLAQTLHSLMVALPPGAPVPVHGPQTTP